jgi:hypothetical protein
MNSTPRSTPPNPTPDLLNYSTVLHKTLGIVGTPHGHSKANIGPPKLAKMRGIEETPQRTPLTRKPRKPKIEPLYSRIWEGNQREKNHEGFKHTPPLNPKEKGLEIAPRKSPRKASENHQKGQTGKTHPSLEEPRRIIYTYQRGSYKV